jgi:tape measure domain-containing protein
MAKSVTNRKVVIEAETKLEKALEDLAKLRKAMEGLGGGSSGKGGLAKVNSEAQKTSTTFTELNQATELLRKGFERAQQALRFFIKDFSFLEQRVVSFRAITGSDGIGDSLLGSLKDIATSTPISLYDSFEGAERLLAFGISVKNIKQDILTLGNIASGVGKDKLNRLMLAFGQVKTAAQLTGQELRQFAEAGVPLLDELAKQMGKTAARVKEDMFKGIKPSFEEVRAALAAMTQEGGKFHNLLEKQAETIAGLEQVTSDKFSLMIASFSEISGITDVWRGTLKDVSVIMDKINSFLDKRSGKNTFSEFEKAISEETEKVLAGYGVQFGKQFETNINEILKGGRLKSDLSNLGRVAYESTIEQVNEALEELRRNKDNLISEIKVIGGSDLTVSDREDRLHKKDGSLSRSQVQKQAFEDAKRAAFLKAKELVVSKALLELEEQQQKLRSQEVSPSQKELFENTKKVNVLRDEGAVALNNEIESMKRLLDVRERHLVSIQEEVYSDGVIRDNEAAKLAEREKLIEATKRYLKLLKEAYAETTKANTVSVYANPYLRFELNDYEKAVRDRIKLDELYEVQKAKIEKRTLEGSQDRLNQMKQNHIDYADARKTIDYQVTESYMNSFKKITDVFANKSKSWFEVSKALGIGQALINTYTGITNALRITDPVTMWAQVAAVASTGFAQVAAIESLRFGSKGSSSSSSSYSGINAGLSNDQESMENMSRRASITDSRNDYNKRLVNAVYRTNEKLDTLIGVTA